MNHLGNCIKCGEPFYMVYKDETKQNGHSDTYCETKAGNVHAACQGVKSLKQLNDERKKDC